MKIKTLKCPNCNAKIELKPGAVDGICTYCNSSFILEDDVIRIEHEIIDNTSLDIANTTLNKFKDYSKAEYLYRNLLYKYAHKEDVYIGLIRCITHDFNKKEITKYNLNEINNFWQKYTSLTTKLNIAKYKNAINELNKDFYLNEIKTTTNNFTTLKRNINISTLERNWHNYLLFSEEKDHLKLEPTYQAYLTKLKEFVAKKNKQRKFILRLVGIITIILVISLTIYSTTETPHPKYKELKTSTLYKYCDPNFTCKDKDFIKNFFHPTLAKLTITDSTFNKDKNTLTVKTTLKSSIRNIKKTYTFNLVDNSGPYIKPTNCKFTDTEKADLTKCFTLTDYTDGHLDSKEATINSKNFQEKKLGTYIVTITAKDKDKNIETRKIPVKVIKTPITLNVSFDKESLEINKQMKLSYEITPQVKDTNVTIDYDKTFISIKNNTITAKKLGTTKICVKATYDNTTTCKELEITPICQNSYTFKFDGSKEETITVGKDICSGTYKIYATVLNNNQTYNLLLHSEGKFGHTEFIGINKTIPVFSKEGRQYAFGKKAYLETKPGVTSITLTK